MRDIKPSAADLSLTEYAASEQKRRTMGSDFRGNLGPHVLYTNIYFTCTHYCKQCKMIRKSKTQGLKTCIHI